jgi:glycosyltransferase involved in cell wall biosynthesis
MIKPLVSVIIPTFNNAQYVGHAIKSALNQTFQDFEIIVIDDGSTDQTDNAIKEFAEYITYIKQKNQGPAAARNAGIRIARGKYIVFLDSDDEFLPEKLSSQQKYLESNPNIDLVYSNGYRFRKNPDGSESLIELQKTNEIFVPKKENEKFVDRLTVKNIFPIHAAMIKSKCIHQIGGFDETLSACEDWDLWYRIAEKFSIGFLHCFTIKYRDTENSNSTDMRRNFKSVETVMQKIMNSVSFHTAPKSVVSNYYFNRGINCLNLKDANRAKDFFKKSYTSNPWRGKSLISFLSTILLGDRALNLFMIKRKIFGSHGRKQF